jgi:hypothetical protein
MKVASIVIAAAVLAAGAAPAAAQQASSGISSQLTALGFDPATVRADIEALNRDDRVAYLRNLGVEIAARPVRPEAVEGVTTPLLSVGEGKSFEVRPLPEGEMHILPIGDVRILPIEIKPGDGLPVGPPHAINGSVNNLGEVRILPMPVDVGGAPGSIAPSRPVN